MAPPQESIVEWPLDRKFREVLALVPAQLPGEFRTQFLQMIRVETVTAGLVVVALASLFGIGQAVMLALVVVLGVDVVTELGKAVAETAFANTKQELESAAAHLARALTIAGIALLLGALARFAKRVPSTSSRAGAPAGESSAVRLSAPRVGTRRTTPQTEPPPRGVPSNQSPTATVASTGSTSTAPSPVATESFASGAAKGPGEILKAGRMPKASELRKYAESQGWKPSQTEGGPLKYIDENGIPRVTIKKGSTRAPGSGSPHVELKDASGRRIDPFGNPVNRKSPENHTPIDYDL